MLAMPALINVSLLFTFGRSLKADQTMIERYARLIEPDLSEAEVIYCRSVTIAWCVLFVFNGVTSGAFAIFASFKWWALFAGVIAYLLMGVVFFVEFIIRKIRFRRYGQGLHDLIFSLFFPPRGPIR